MESTFFQLNKTKYNKEFVFLTEEKLRFKGKNYDKEKGFNKLVEEQVFGIYKDKFVIFTTTEVLRELEKEIKPTSKVNIVKNDKDFYMIENAYFRYVNFYRVAGVNKVRKVKDEWGIAGDDDLVLMENFIKFLKGFGVSNPSLASKWLSGIQAEIFYQDLSKEDLDFKRGRYNPMISSEQSKRRFVYKYLKEDCESSAILETTVGDFRDVISIDGSSFYPFILIAFKFMVDDPYPYFSKEQDYGGRWDFLPIKFRRHIIEFYDKKEENKTNRKFYKRCINCLTGRSISEYGLAKSNQSKTNFLGPQHGFQVIEIGRQLLEELTQKLIKIGCKILERDTDGIKVQGDLKAVQELVNEENKQIVWQLIKSGLSYGEANCGIGQWKIEYVAEKFKQTAAKHYSYCVDGKWTEKGKRDDTIPVMKAYFKEGKNGD